MGACTSTFAPGRAVIGHGLAFAEPLGALVLIDLGRG